MISLIFVVGLIIFTVSLIMAFDPPTNIEILSAIGSTNELPDSLQRALSIIRFIERICGCVFFDGRRHNTDHRYT